MKLFTDKRSAITRLLSVSLTAAMLGGMTLAASAEGELPVSIESKGTIVYDDNDDGTPEVRFEVEDLNNLNSAIATANANIEEENRRVGKIEETVSDAKFKINSISGQEAEDLTDSANALLDVVGSTKIPDVIGHINDLTGKSDATLADANVSLLKGMDIGGSDGIPRSGETTPDTSSWTNNVISEDDHSAYAEFVIPEGYYNESQTAKLNLTENNNYYYSVGYADSPGLSVTAKYGSGTPSTYSNTYAIFPYSNFYAGQTATIEFSEYVTVTHIDYVFNGFTDETNTKSFSCKVTDGSGAVLWNATNYVEHPSIGYRKYSLGGKNSYTNKIMMTFSNNSSGWTPCVCGIMITTKRD